MAAARSLPPRLEREPIAAGIHAVTASIFACGTLVAARGTVTVEVAVQADGRVASVIVQATPAPALGECVAGAIEAATFAPTRRGGTFIQPVVF